jgi:hypothetical protein
MSKPRQSNLFRALPIFIFSVFFSIHQSYSQNQNNGSDLLLADTNFTILAQLQADSFATLDQNVVRYLNGEKQIIFPKMKGGFYQDIRSNERHYLIRNNKNWGLMNAEGEIVLAPEFDSIAQSGLFFLYKKSGKWGLLDSLYQSVAEPQYDFLQRSATNNCFYFRKGDQVGYLKLGELSFSTTAFDSISQLNSSFFWGWKQGKGSLLNNQLEKYNSKSLSGAWLGPDFSINAFDKDSLYRLLPNSTTWQSEKCKVVARLNDSLILVRLSGNMLSIYQFARDKCTDLEADTAWQHFKLPKCLILRKSDTLAISTLQGELVTGFSVNLRRIGLEKNGFISVSTSQTAGYVDTCGRLLVSTRYEEVGHFSQGHGSVKIKGKWGFVDINEKILVQPRYEKVGFFHNGLAMVNSKGFCTLVNNQGIEQFLPLYDDIKPTHSKYWLTQSKLQRFGFLDSNAKEVHTPKFEKVKETSVGFFIVTQYGKEGVLDRKLELVHPLKEKEIVWLDGPALFAIRK